MVALSCGPAITLRSCGVVLARVEVAANPRVEHPVVGGEINWPLRELHWRARSTGPKPPPLADARETVKRLIVEIHGVNPIAPKAGVGVPNRARHGGPQVRGERWDDGGQDLEVDNVVVPETSAPCSVFIGKAVKPREY